MRVRIYLGSSSNTQPNAHVRGNTVTLDPATIYAGIMVENGWGARVAANTVTGGRDQGTIRAAGSDGNRVRWVRIDSNTVQIAKYWGIRTEWVDSVSVRGNLVEDVTSPQCCYGPTTGAIAVAQTRFAARIAGNTVRRSGPPGIAVAQQEYYYYTLDTARVFVDSNAL